MMGKVIPKNPGQLRKMRKAGRTVAAVLDVLKREAGAGVTTAELDSIAEAEIKSRNAVPAFKGYRGFPASICASVNSEVVHGIPGGRVLKNGDLLSIDVGVFVDGFAGDAAITIGIGDCSSKALRIMRKTEEALEAALRVIKPGVKVSEISHAIESVACPAGFGLVRKYTGHGIGAQMHEPPQIPNVAPKGAWIRSPRLPEGATIAIEPMLTEGNGDVEVLEDGWTVVTADRKLSAHAEHTVAVGAAGAVLMTVK